MAFDDKHTLWHGQDNQFAELAVSELPGIMIVHNTYMSGSSSEVESATQWFLPSDCCGLAVGASSALQITSANMLRPAAGCGIRVPV
jgi:hypothetical protein